MHTSTPRTGRRFTALAARMTLTAMVGALVAIGAGSAVPTAHAASTSLVISEFRLRGNGPTSAADEYIEIQNISASNFTVLASTGTGFGIAASDGLLRCTIPNFTVIPRYGHYLCANNTAGGYSLGGYPAGSGLTATANATFTTDIPDNAGIALFNTNIPANFSLAQRFDAVGSASEANTLYKEGAGYPTQTPFPINYSFYRNLSTPSITNSGLDTATPGLSEDTDNNATDFVYVDTNGTSNGGLQLLGAPGPENLSSPVPNGSLAVSLLDPCVDASTSPNAVRDTTSVPPQNSTFGTTEFRRTVTNNTGANVTKLRFRIADQRTFPAPSTFADMRTRSTGDTVAVVHTSPCGATTTVAVLRGTTVEEPPGAPNGSAFNSTLGANFVTLGAPLAPGASINVRLLFGSQQVGKDSVRIVAEAVSAGTVTPPTLTCLGMTFAPDFTNFCINASPVAGADTYAAIEDTALVVAAPGVLANDSDPDSPVTVQTGSLVAPIHGALTLNSNGAFTYTPTTGYFGADSFTYKATDGAIDSAATTVSLSITPAGATHFVPLTPSRLLDTRDAADITGGARVAAGTSIDLQITGRGGVPASGVSAVVLNVTAADTEAAGFVTIWPAGQVQPTASSLNVTSAAQNIANLVTVAVGDSGKITLFSESGTHFLADVAGYYEPVSTPVAPGRFNAVAPTRVLDTREALGVAGTTPLPADSSIDLVVAGFGGVPTSGVSAVVLNVTAVDAAGPGFVTVWPKGLERPVASTLNATFAGQNIPNAAVVPVGADGSISLYSQSGGHLVVDVAGWFGDATQVPSLDGLFQPLSPARLLDTRSALGVPGTTPVAAGTSIDLAITGHGGVPASGVLAAVLNITVADAIAPGFVTVWPAGQTQPTASTLNVTFAGQNIANHSTVTLSAAGAISLYSQSGTHLLADIAGYYIDA